MASSPFSGSKWQTDMAAALDAAYAMVEMMAEAKDWPQVWEDYGGDLIAQAKNASDEPIGFFRELTELWVEAQDDVAWEVPGWEEAGRTFATAAGASYNAEKNNVSAWDIVEGTVSGTVEDLGEAVDWWGKHGKKVIVGAAVVGALLYSRK